MINEDDGVTLHEVKRNVSTMRTEVWDLTKDVTEPRVSTGTQADKTKRLESVVYGALVTSTAGLITAWERAWSARSTSPRSRPCDGQGELPGGGQRVCPVVAT